MKTRVIAYLAIAVGILLFLAGTRAWAGSGSGCCDAKGSQQSCAMNNDGQMSATADMHQGQTQTSMMDMATLHGGQGHEAGPYKFETVFTESDARLYVTRTDGASVDLKHLSGTATITGTDEKLQTVEFTAKKVADDPMASHRRMAGMTDDQPAYLSAPYTFGNLPDEAVTVDIALKGVAGTEDGPAEWQQAFAMTPLFGNACPMHTDQAALSDGACSICGGMALQPARVLYECCPNCPNMRSTSPTTCSKCGMEMHLKSVGGIDAASPAQEQPHMNMGHMEHAG